MHTNFSFNKIEVAKTAIFIALDENTWLREALVFACAAHEAVGQKRKYTNEAYFNHPQEVYRILVNNIINNYLLMNKTLEGIDINEAQVKMLMAAYLHDVVEDTEICLETIEIHFGQTVGEHIMFLTDISTPADGNRAARKAIDREHLSKAPADTQTIKYADLISNTKSIVEHDPKFAKTYLAEKRLLLDVLTKGDRLLWNKASDLCDSGIKALKREGWL